ncbi:MAG: DDE transposase family protein [Cyanobacteria bacterium RM1_2_2]|nr:DDE transposase family protein [Cyanobacteria bacterium RM1_2_2]
MATEAEANTWYVLKHADGHCEVTQIDMGEGSAPGEEEEEKSPQEQWGPFASEDEANARRVGLIRAGKCQPQ